MQKKRNKNKMRGEAKVRQCHHSSFIWKIRQKLASRYNGVKYVENDIMRPNLDSHRKYFFSLLSTTSYETSADQTENFF
jgi:hypothetical protein